MSPSPSRPKKRARKSATAADDTNQFPPFDKAGLSTTTARGKHAFKWLLSGISPETFFSEYFEKKPFHAHNPSSKFQSLLSISSIRALIESKKLHYGSDLDVTQYTPSKGRSTLNKPNGRPVGKEAWHKFSTCKCSLRLLRPQKHFDNVWHICWLLESFLGCMVGANSYLTPGNSQGFAPHFDDVDAFICQVEGKKRWKVYKLKGQDGWDVLPRTSSIDFSKEEMQSADVLYDVVLQPGDMLYLPRGFVHEAECVHGEDAVKHGSLHVTISAFQKWTWADLLLHSFQLAIRSAAAEDKMLRKTLPLRFTEFMGVSKMEQRKEQREWFVKKVNEMVARVGKAYPCDAAADNMATRFMKERLPPVRLGEAARGQVGVGDMVRVVEAGVVRIVMDHAEGGNQLPKMIYCVNNERGTGVVEGEMVCLPEEAFAVDVLVDKYPQGMKVGDLPLEKDDDCVQLVQGLVEMSIVEVM